MRNLLPDPLSPPPKLQQQLTKQMMDDAAFHMSVTAPK